MKLLTMAIALVPALSWAQVKGNKQVVTQSFNVQNIRSVEIGLYAEVMIDCAEEEMLMITIDQNLMDRVEKSVDENGKLLLTQKEWIQPSERVKIAIGAPDLDRVEQSTHETTTVRNIDALEFRSMAIVGKIELSGKVETLFASGEIGHIDAQALDADNVELNLWDRGKIELGNPQSIRGTVKVDGLVTYRGTVEKINTNGRGKVMRVNQASKVKNPEARFIKFKLKNNSLNRINCYVVGPKPDGSKFSYGFPMNPGQSRDKDWSIGSKVYRVTGIGTRKLLKQIAATDEGQIVKLYDKD